MAVPDRFPRPRKPGAISSRARSGDTLLRMRRRRLSGSSPFAILRNKPREALSESEKKIVEHEMALAADIQENLMPRQIPRLEGYEITAYYKPCQDVGGDYYDFLHMGPGRTGMLVADVAGKGVPGAMVMVNSRAYLRALSEKCDNLREIAIRLNSLLYDDIPRGMFVTMYFAVLDPIRHTLTCMSLGHNPMIWWRAESGTCHIVNPNGLALGVDRGPIFEKTVKEQVIQLQPGDRFFLYTDGVVEAMDERNQMFGPQRLYRTIKQMADKDSSETVSLLMKSIEEHQGHADQHDDITIITGRLLPVNTPLTAGSILPPL